MHFNHDFTKLRLVSKIEKIFRKTTIRWPLEKKKKVSVTVIVNLFLRAMQ